MTTLGTAVITGASSGIGAIYADRLAKRGYDLLLVARSQDKMDIIANKIRQETGRQVTTIRGDLTNSADLAQLTDTIKQDGNITLLVNNAGFGKAQPLLESDIAQMREMVTLNISSLMELSYAAAPQMAARGQGAIINISSVVAISPELLNGVYGGSKAFVLAFSQSLHHELADKGVRVQVVLPGATATDFWNVAGVPAGHLPQEIIMSAEDMVDASLAGFDQGELVTIPALPDIKDWQAMENARQALKPNLSHNKSAARYNLK